VTKILSGYTQHRHQPVILDSPFNRLFCSLLKQLLTTVKFQMNKMNNALSLQDNYSESDQRQAAKMYTKRNTVQYKKVNCSVLPTITMRIHFTVINYALLDCLWKTQNTNTFCRKRLNARVSVRSAADSMYGVQQRQMPSFNDLSFRSFYE